MLTRPSPSTDVPAQDAKPRQPCPAGFVLEASVLIRIVLAHGGAIGLILLLPLYFHAGSLAQNSAKPKACAARPACGSEGKYPCHLVACAMLRPQCRSGVRDCEAGTRRSWAPANHACSSAVRSPQFGRILGTRLSSSHTSPGMRLPSMSVSASLEERRVRCRASWMARVHYELEATCFSSLCACLALPRKTPPCLLRQWIVLGTASHGTKHASVWHRDMLRRSLPAAEHGRPIGRASDVRASVDSCRVYRLPTSAPGFPGVSGCEGRRHVFWGSTSRWSPSPGRL